MANQSSLNSSYGTGTALDFSNGENRFVLELGPKIHYYNPDATPLLTLMGRMATMATPVPEFEWMEDEHFIRKAIVCDIVTQGADSATTNVSDTAYTGQPNSHDCVINFQRQSQMEGLEVGAVYLATQSAGSMETDVTHVLCVAIGKDVDLTSPSHMSAQFVGVHTGTVGGENVWYVEACADGDNLFGAGSGRTLTLTYVNTAGRFYDNGTATNFFGYNINVGAHAASGDVGNLADAAYFIQEGGMAGYAEGAGIGVETRKKVRRLKNCTQIFREPYTITGTANASKFYGGDELSRLQARKLHKIKTDIEYALLTNTAASFDATSENPKRTFQGFGVGAAASSGGAVQSLNGYGNSNLQISASSPSMADMDTLCEEIFMDTLEGSPKKTVFASNKWLKVMAKLVRETSSVGEFQLMHGSDITAGLRVSSYLGPIGQLDFVPHPMLRGSLEDYAIAVDFSNVNWRPLASRDMQLRADVVKDGRDGQTDEWMMEVGPEIRQEQTHAIIKLT